MTIKILCTLPNASTRINGVAFEPVEGGVQSVDELTQEHIDHFGAIEGYTLFDTDADGDDQDSAPSDNAQAAQAPRGRGRPPKVRQ